MRTSIFNLPFNENDLPDMLYFTPPSFIYRPVSIAENLTIIMTPVRVDF
jgi:hypothetical protein